MENGKQNSNCHVILIIEYWLRTLFAHPCFFDDPTKIITEFAHEYEQFESFETSRLSLKKKNNGLTLYKYDSIDDNYNGFGKIIATKGRIYHWELKITTTDERYLNIGIVEADAFHWYDITYCYYNTAGNFYDYGSKKCVPYGDTYTSNDIIDVWLDMANKYELSFAKNGKRYGTACCVCKDKEYRLAIGMLGNHTVDILAFNMTFLFHK
eukprot:484486_1